MASNIPPVMILLWSSDWGYLATGVTQQRRRQGMKLQVGQVSLTWVSGSSRYFSHKMQAQLYRAFSTPLPQVPATAGQWLMDQSGLSCLWLLWPGKKLHDTELAEADGKLWESHKQSPKWPSSFAKDDDVKVTTETEILIWGQKHLYF